MSLEAETWLHRDMRTILNRLVRRPEFAEEISRLKLTPHKVVVRVAEDPAVLASARHAYESLASEGQALDAHERDAPRWWPRTWEPDAFERRLLWAIPCVLAVWIATVALLGTWLPDAVELGLVIVVVLIVGVLALRGLPEDVWLWLLWKRDHTMLAVGLPVRRRDRRQVLQDEVLVPGLRGWLSRQTQPSFELTLELRDAAGLTKPPGQGALVQTDAVEACRREVNRDYAGAVGLAGPRGAGKTTIAERAARDEFTDPERPPVLGVLTSAPVRYDARDFILHLHTCVCRAVLDFIAASGTQSETHQQWNRLHRKHRIRAGIGELSRIVLSIGVRLGLALGVATLAWGWPPNPALLGGFVKDLVTDLGGFRTVSWSDVVVFLGLLPLFFAALRVVLGLLRGVTKGVFRTVRRLHGWLSDDRVDPELAALRSLAHQQLRSIRFLQTHTSGWSGKVSVPAGTDLSMTRSLAKAEQPWTHPEVVGRLRDFIEVSIEVLSDQVSKIVVTIDEVDKIADPDEAHQFLNEIKGVFGVPRCLFLVSVSDDALTAFERRGIPARDAFDSAFTSMIHVRPFTLEQSRTWLAHRALGIPEPFVWLCHCMSGGLPRDLGRVALTLYDLQRDHTQLSAVTHAMLARDLDIKTRAFAQTAKPLPRTGDDSPHTLIKHLSKLPLDDHFELAELARQIWPDTDSPLDTELARLRAEVACYLVFCQTIAEIFHDRLDPAGKVDAVIALATARQHMALDTLLAWNVLTDFRATVNPG
ncbi:hypothetical protein [Actinosynnema sp. ALI-1.44]|uniref:hypothetical protein n=1 Tax=Actinosynnema sp. ALI-1.44 TaxID=1933779 RepID=UPI0011784BEB|nr:hypothetical protein [Actinosynnema sp. ALI-1.44]